MVKMFCLPYAGGNSLIYNPWKNGTEMEVVPIEYKGHGSLIAENLNQSMEEIIADMSKRIENMIAGEYLLYGHSMGAFVAFETAYNLVRRGCRKPSKIILAGVRPPHLIHMDKKYTHLSKDLFMKALYDMGEIPKEIFENEEYYIIYFEILFNDFKIIEEYKHDHSYGVLDVPMIVLAGDEDYEAPESSMLEWKNYAGSEFEFHMMKGNHFFAFNENSDFIEKLSKLL